MENAEIAQVLNQVADILELLGENQFRVGAYRRAAQEIESLPQDINEVYKQGKLDEIPGVGKSITQKIEELIKTGRLKELERLKKKIPLSLTKLLQIEGLGPKTVIFLYKKFKVTNLSQLKKLLRSHKLLQYKGFKEKTEENIWRGIKLYEKHKERFLLGRAYILAQQMVESLKNFKEVERVELAGSVRRMKETIGDLDILVTSKKPSKVMDYFVSLPQVEEIEVKGRTKTTVILKIGIENDLRVVSPDCFGAALYYFTGSKAHNIRVRRIALEKGLKINEYGVFRIKDNKKIAGQEEEEVFKAVGLKWIPPELREDRGEIEAALEGKLPKLVKLKDIKGDLHLHTNWSDGAHTIEEMVKKAIEKKYEYLAITDHASPMGIIQGIAGKRALEQIREIKRIRKKYKNKIKLLSGVEVDILPDGRLYLPDEILKKLDIVIAAVHFNFRMSEKKMTQRIIKAIKNPWVKIIAHPTGRIIGKREGYSLDMEEIFSACQKYHTYLELNAFWNRLDLNDIHCRMAKEKGIKIVINTDSHNKMEMDNMKFGVGQARRGWLEKRDVLNTLSWEKFKKELNLKIKI